MNKILVVGEEITTAKVIKEFLSLAGYEILSAFDGRQALQMAKEKQPDSNFNIGQELV